MHQNLWDSKSNLTFLLHKLVIPGIYYSDRKLTDSQSKREAIEEGITGQGGREMGQKHEQWDWGHIQSEKNIFFPNMGMN